jgi:hypothetical protein
MTVQSTIAVSRSLASCWVDRIREILPADEFDVSAHGPAVNLGPRRGDGPWETATPIIMLSLPGSAEEKLARAYRLLAESIPEIVWEVRGRPWPGPNPTTHVSVGPDRIEVWWESSVDPDATVRLRPILRSELGM